MVCLQFLFLTIFTGIVKGNNKIVQTKYGFVRGTSVGSRGVTAFLGIPYAEPPVGSLRFAKPVAKAPWTDIYNATDLPPPCIQGQSPIPVFYAPDTSNMTEDCLYLNLWVPTTRNAYDLKAILIIIHGGWYMTGASRMRIFHGATLAEYGDVIVASLNYRVGALGFFYGSIHEAAGNMAMYDQVMAIRWIKENAYAFGGDPERIVLLGHSSGSFSISAHLISPLSQNLFKRAILLSGSIIHPMYLDNNKRLSRLSQNYSQEIGCSADNMTLENNPKAVIECMKSLPAQVFSAADAKFFFVDQERFFLRVGDHFLPESPTDSYQKGNFPRKEILLGNTRNEGPFLLAASMPLRFGMYGELATNNSFDENQARQIMKTFLRTGFDFADDTNIQIYLNRVQSEEGYTYLRAMGDAVGDFIITCGVIFQADFLSLRNDPVYFYMFDFRPPSTPMAEWMGVTHQEDVPYFTGNPQHSSNFTEYEMMLSRNVMDMVLTFIKTGNPNTGRGVIWPRYSYHDPKYMTIGKHKRVEWSKELNRCEIWRKVYGTVMDEDVIRSLRDSERAEIMGLPRWYGHSRQNFRQEFFRGYGNFEHSIPNEKLLKTGHSSLHEKGFIFPF